MRVALYAIGGNKRAQHIARSMADGLRHCGIAFIQRDRFSTVEADVAIAYGWTHEPVFSAYKAAGARYACWDLGYWGRRPRTEPHNGHHRLSIDDWDTINIMALNCPDDRLRALGVKVMPDYCEGDELLLAGMSAKAAGTHGYEAGEWEARTVQSLRDMTEVKIVLRPKPSKTYQATERIEDALARTRILVTHHSNAAVDALVAGVPVHAVKGIGSLASPFGALSAAGIQNPFRLRENKRRQLLANTAYAQWTPAEMRNGAAWNHIKELLK